MSTSAIIWMPQRLSHYGDKRRRMLVAAMVRSAFGPEMRGRLIVIHGMRRRALRTPGAEVVVKVTIR